MYSMINHQMSCQRRLSASSTNLVQQPPTTSSACNPSNSSSTSNDQSTLYTSSSSVASSCLSINGSTTSSCSTTSSLLLIIPCPRISSCSQSAPPVLMEDDVDDDPSPDECNSSRKFVANNPNRCCMFTTFPISASPPAEKSSSCPSLAALFSTTTPDNNSRSASTFPILQTHQQHHHPNYHRKNQHRHRRHHQRCRNSPRQHCYDKSTPISSKDPKVKRTFWCRTGWPSFVCRWRSTVGGAGLFLLLLQFCWMLPYICFANYLERCLLPLRMYCYTDPDLLYARRPLRARTADCAAYFFANNAAELAHRRIKHTTCKLNHTLPVLLLPSNAMPTNTSYAVHELHRVVVIRSAPRAMDYRMYIRNSWKPAVERLVGPVVFVVGRDSSKLPLEDADHGDILQLDFEDSYNNLPTKMMGIYRFFTERTTVQQIVVVNDDTIVNATALEGLFRNQSSIVPAGQSRYMIGKVSRAYPRIVFPWLPWFVEADLYPHKCYPPFVQGSSFVISRAAAMEVLRHVCDFPSFAIHLDDILMGLLTNCLGIANIHRDGFDVGHSLASFTVFHYQFSRYTATSLMGMFTQIRHQLIT